MVNLIPIRAVLTAFILIGALGAVGPAMTQSQFTDVQTGVSNVTAASDFNRDFPRDAVAYDDANENGQYDGGETVYTTADLTNVEDSSAELRFHSSTGGWITLESSTIQAANISSEEPIKIEAGSIDWSVSDHLEVEDATLDADSLQLTANNGDVTATGLKAKESDSILISTDRGDVYLSNADLRASGSIRVYAQSGIIDVTDTKCRSGDIELVDGNGSVSC